MEYSITVNKYCGTGEKLVNRIMGIDYGDARTGVAISDLLCSIVGSTCVVPSRNTEKAIADIVQLVKENGVGQIVWDCPKIWSCHHQARNVLSRLSF